MGDRSQSILNYPLKEEKPSSILYTYKRDFPDDDLNDKIINSKKLFKYEDNFMTKEEQKIKKFNELALAQDICFQDYLEKIDPIDKDLNYFKMNKLSHEFVHEHIQYQTVKFQNTSEVLKVFAKKNENINFFLSDFDGIIENHEIDVQKEEKKRQYMNNSNNNKNNINNNKEDYQNNEVQEKQLWIARENTHSQGKCFFYVEKNMSYELVKEYPDNHYIEIRNKEYPEQIGIFRKKDFNPQQGINHDKDSKLQPSQNSINSSHILNLQEDSKLRETSQDIEDHSVISHRSKKQSISIPLNGRKRSFSKKGNFINVPNTPIKTSQNLKLSAQMSTAASRRY